MPAGHTGTRGDRVVSARLRSYVFPPNDRVERFATAPFPLVSPRRNPASVRGDSLIGQPTDPDPSTPILLRARQWIRWSQSAVSLLRCWTMPVSDAGRAAWGNAALKAQLGVELFERGARRATLTAAERSLLRDARTEEMKSRARSVARSGRRRPRSPSMSTSRGRRSPPAFRPCVAATRP